MANINFPRIKLMAGTWTVRCRGYGYDITDLYAAVYFADERNVREQRVRDPAAEWLLHQEVVTLQALRRAGRAREMFKPNVIYGK